MSNFTPPPSPTVRGRARSRRRRRGLAPVVLAVALFAGACGGDDEPTLTTTDTTTEPTAVVDESSTDETNADGRLETLFVSGVVDTCEGEGTFTCYPATIGSIDGDRTNIYEGEIAGFTHEAGHSYELLVRITDVDNPPADASSIAYELIEIVSDTVE